MSSRQARAVSFKVCKAPKTMQALSNRGSYVVEWTLHSGFSGVTAEFATFQPGADRCHCASTDAAGSAGARPVLQGLLAASRAVWDVSPAVLHRAAVLAVTLRVGDNSQPPTLFLVYKTCYFPCKHERDSWFTSPARAVHPLCGAREK